LGSLSKYPNQQQLAKHILEENESGEFTPKNKVRQKENEKKKKRKKEKKRKRKKNTKKARSSCRYNKLLV